MAEEVLTGKVNCLGRKLSISGYADDQYFKDLTELAAPELDLLTMTALLVNPGDIVLDVGANLGFYSTSTATLLGEKGKVLSFEPSRKNYKMLVENVKANDMQKNIKTFNYGLSDEDAIHHLLYNTSGRAGAFISDESDMARHHSADESIQTKIFDEIDMVKRCHLMKVDIEGHEPNFLRGAENTIARLKPACLMEANHWCLNALNNTTMPQFLEQVQAIFPYVYAFDSKNIIDVNNNKFDFMYKNIVNNQVQNLYCDFDQKRAKQVVASYQKFLSFGAESSTHREEMENLIKKNEQLENDIAHMRAAKSHKVIKRINRTFNR